MTYNGHTRKILENAMHRSMAKGGIGFIYFLIDGDEIVYVGQTKNAKSRIDSHVNGDKVFDKFAFEPWDLASLNEIEAFYIVAYRPKYNKRLPANDTWMPIRRIAEKVGKTTSEINLMISRRNMRPAWDWDCAMYDWREFVGGET